MWKDYFKLHVIIFLWGFTAIVGAWLTLSPLVVVVYRTLLAVVGMLVVMRWHRLPFAIDTNLLAKLLGVGAIVALHWFLFFASARASTVSICLVGLASAAFWTSILDPLLSRRAAKWYELALGGVVVAGMAMLAHFESKYWLGLLMGVASALCASLFTIINGQLTKQHHHLVISFYEMVGALATSMLLAAGAAWGYGLDMVWLPDTSVSAWAWWTDAANLIFLGWVCTVYAYATSVELMRRIPPFVVNLSVNLEPVYGIVFAAFLFDEWSSMSSEFYISTVVILASVFAHPYLERWNNKQ